MLLEEGLVAQDYVAKYVNGFEVIRPWFDNVDIGENCRVCALSQSKVRRFARLLATRQNAMQSDLGLLMGRHSSLHSYLERILLTLIGRIGGKGGCTFPGNLRTIRAHTPEEDPATWRTVVTNIPQIMGIFPPNVLPEEIKNQHPQRIRALLLGNCNPLRSYADTSVYEQALAKLDLLVTVEIAMTETAALSHYVLPAKSGYEKWDSTFFNRHYPAYYFHMRPPVVEAQGEAVEESEIYLALAERLGLIPEYPAELRDLARDRIKYGTALRAYLSGNPKAAAWTPYILAKTLGQELGSNNLAALWMLVQQFVQNRPEDVARAGYMVGPDTAEELFQKILDNPGGVKIGVVDAENNLSRLETPNKKINIHFPEMLSWIKEVEPKAEGNKLINRDYPMILMAGNHMDMVANTNMRDPAWNEGRRACTMRIHPTDAAELGLKDGETALIETEIGSVEAEAEVTESSHLGQVVIPHGFGLLHENKVYGVNINRLSAASHRDRIAATPLHRYIPCRIRKS